LMIWITLPLTGCIDGGDGGEFGECIGFVSASTRVIAKHEAICFVPSRSIDTHSASVLCSFLFCYQ
jgi:hypothetical protein